MDIRLVVFDMDGTLLGAPKTFQELKEGLKSKLLKMGVDEKLIGDLTPMYESLGRISLETGLDFEELYSLLVELEVERIEESFLFEGAVEVLEFLRERNIPTALMTRSSRKATMKALDMHGIGGYFSLISTRDDVPQEDLKPNTGQLQSIISNFGVEPSKVLVVGDHGYDVIPAKKLGCLSVKISGHTAGRMSFDVDVEPHFEIETLKELSALIENLLNTYVVVPAYNEEKTVASVLRGLLVHFKPEEIIVVNDGSWDRTGEIARSMGVRVLNHLINRGLGGALGTGIKYAILKGARAVVTFDADGQHRVEDALRVMRPVVEGKADFAVGSRLKGDVSEMPFVKRLGNFFLDVITATFAGKYVSDSQSGLRCISRGCASKIRITCDRYAVSSELIIEAAKKGCRIAEVPIKAVYTKYSMKKGTNVFEGIKIAVNLLFDKLR